MNSPLESDLIFDGTNGVPSDVFVRSIRVRMLTQGTHKDDEFIAQTAACCLQGRALTWYEDQADEVQESWKLLRRAILIRWPPLSDSEAAAPTPSRSAVASPVSHNVPTPAAAPPAAAARSFSPSSSTVDTQTNFKGRIRVCEDSAALGYLGMALDENGHYEIIRNASDGVVVQLVPLGASFELHVLNAAGANQNRRLGMTWSWGKSLEQVKGGTEATWGGLVSLFGSGPGGKTSSTVYTGASASDIWHIGIDGRMVVSWEIETRLNRTLIGVFGRTLNVTTNYDGFIKDITGHVKKVTFWFERL